MLFIVLIGLLSISLYFVRAVGIRRNAAPLSGSCLGSSGTTAAVTEQSAVAGVARVPTMRGRKRDRRRSRCRACGRSRKSGRCKRCQH